MTSCKRARELLPHPPTGKHPSLRPRAWGGVTRRGGELLVIPPATYCDWLFGSLKTVFNWL